MCSILLASINSSFCKSKEKGEEMNIEDEEILETYLENCLTSRNNALYRGQLSAFIFYQGMVDIIAQILVDRKAFKDDDYKGVT